GDAGPGRDTDHPPCRGRAALAALEGVEDRIEVPQEHRDARRRNVATELRREPYREPALAGITRERKHRSHLLSRAQYIRRPGILRSVAARIGQAHEAAHHDGERDRADAVRRENGEGGRHAGSILPRAYNAPRPWTTSSSATSGCRRSSAFTAASGSCRRPSGSTSRSASRTPRYSRATRSPTASTTTRSRRASAKSPPIT